MRGAGGAVWAVSVLVLALISLAALVATPGWLVPSFPGVVAAGSLAVGAVVIIAARHAASWPPVRGRRLPLLIVGLAVGLRLGVAVVADAPLAGENVIIHEQALGVMDGICCFSHRPMGYPIVLAASYELLGVGPGAIELLNIVFAAATTVLVWEIGRAGWGRPVGAAAAAAYALMPSQLLMTLVPLTEPLYTMLVMVAIRAGMTLRGRSMLVNAAVVAAALAAGQYVRATTALILVPIVALPFTAGWSVIRTLRRAAMIVAVFVVLLIPVIAFNLEQHGDLSVSTSAYGGWSLYVGANREHGGQWNAQDAQRLAGFPGDSWWERSAHAGGLVAGRIAEDPLGSLALLPRKFATLWGDESYATGYALDGTGTVVGAAIGAAVQLWWLLISMLATIGIWSWRHRRRPAVALLIGSLIATVAVAHLALEVQSRYHAYLVPLLCVLAAAGAERLFAGRSLVTRRPA